MAERKTRITLFGHPVEATEVPVSRAMETDNEYTLEDGSVIRVKVPVTQVLRVEGQYDGEGNPFYLVKTGTIVTVISASEGLRKQSSR